MIPLQTGGVAHGQGVTTLHGLIATTEQSSGIHDAGAFLIYFLDNAFRISTLLANADYFYYSSPILREYPTP